MALGAMNKRTRVVILTGAFIIKGDVTVPTNMRFSDALNRFLKDLQFLAIVDVETLDSRTGSVLEKRDFMLVNKEQIIAIAPID